MNAELLDELVEACSEAAYCDQDILIVGPEYAHELAQLAPQHYEMLTGFPKFMGMLVLRDPDEERFRFVRFLDLVEANTLLSKLLDLETKSD